MLRGGEVWSKTTKERTFAVCPGRDQGRRQYLQGVVTSDGKQEGTSRGKHNLFFSFCLSDGSLSPVVMGKRNKQRDVVKLLVSREGNVELLDLSKEA